jgi:3'-phosphoadenosine 5'-phosphosulfate sulfotransferase (PAPS reductase)/FAD synthetase
MKRDPYLIDEPFIVSFSGGLTSGYMTTQIVEAFRRERGGWPDGGRIVFCNTGKEREETLRFVEQCSQWWGVPVVWLEYRWGPGRHYFEIVTFATASRKGEPFELLILSRNRVPSTSQRFCTIDLKMRTHWRYTRSLGWTDYVSAVGLRYDEPKRVRNRLAYTARPAMVPTLYGEEEAPHKEPINDGEEAVCPLFDARVTLQDVEAFWRAAPFHLALSHDEGNCDCCFLKSADKLVRLAGRRPQDFEWWAEQERRTGSRFSMIRPSYAELPAIARGKIGLPLLAVLDDDETLPCSCTD